MCGEGGGGQFSGDSLINGERNVYLVPESKWSKEEKFIENTLYGRHAFSSYKTTANSGLEYLS